MTLNSNISSIWFFGPFSNSHTQSFIGIVFTYTTWFYFIVLNQCSQIFIRKFIRILIRTYLITDYAVAQWLLSRAQPLILFYLIPKKPSTSTEIFTFNRDRPGDLCVWYNTWLFRARSTAIQSKIKWLKLNK